LEEVEALTDRIAVISDGKIKAVGTVQDLLDKTGASNLEDAFISLAEGGNE
jgi:ABC-2 type transport system ATP-binding protein